MDAKYCFLFLKITYNNTESVANSQMKFMKYYCYDSFYS